MAFKYFKVFCHIFKSHKNLTLYFREMNDTLISPKKSLQSHCGVLFLIVVIRKRILENCLE